MTSFSSGYDIGQLAFFTNRNEVKSILSTRGMELRVDDDCDGIVSEDEEEWLIDAMAEATDEVASYLTHKYDHDVLAGNRWVRRIASYYACSILCRRKGNPDLYCDEVEQYERKLNQVLSGKRLVPNAMPKTVLAPRMSNIVVDHNYMRNKIRVDRMTSGGRDVPRPHDDHAYPFYWGWVITS